MTENPFHKVSTIIMCQHQTVQHLLLTYTLPPLSNTRARTHPHPHLISNFENTIRLIVLHLPYFHWIATPTNFEYLSLVTTYLRFSLSLSLSLSIYIYIYIYIFVYKYILPPCFKPRSTTITSIPINDYHPPFKMATDEPR